MREALQSAVGQTYPHIEVLIVDDGSTDDTLAIAAEFTRAYPQVRLVHNHGQNSMVGNWEECVAEARHPWIKYLFQDDVLAPGCVEEMLRLCLHEETLMAFCRRNFIVEDNAPARTQEFLQVVPRPETLFAPGKLAPQAVAEQVVKYGTQNIMGEPPCWLFHKSLVTQLGTFDTRFRQSMDLEFVLRAALAKGIAFTPSPLVEFRLHGDSETTSNTHATDDPAVFRRSIRTLWGDDLLLLNTYLTDERFRPVREQWTTEELSSRIRFLYLRACREYGSRFINEALQDVIAAVPLLQNLRYSYLRYKIERFRYNTMLKKRKRREGRA